MNRGSTSLTTSPAQKRLIGYLCLQLRASVVLHLNRNASRVSWSRQPADVWHIHLHEAFLEAGEEVRAALVRHLRTQDPQAEALLERFLRALPLREERSGPSRTPACKNPCGQFHDLTCYFNELNLSYFAGEIRAEIGWGRFSGRRGGRSVRLGSYERLGNVIRIHPALDQEWVPGFFVRSVVHHEMVHAHLDRLSPAAAPRPGHPPEFRELERAFADHEQAVAWEKGHLGRLLQEFH